MRKLEDEHVFSKRIKEQADLMEKRLAESMMQVEDKRMQSESAEKKLVVMRMKISDLMTKMDDEHYRSESAKEQIDILQKLLSDHQTSTQVKLRSCNYWSCTIDAEYHVLYLFSYSFSFSGSSFVLLIKFRDTCSFCFFYKMKIHQ